MTKPWAGPEVANFLLRTLPRSTLDRLGPRLAAVELSRGQIICKAGARSEYVHLVDNGLISITKDMNDGRVAEIGVVGVEGAADIDAMFGLDQAPFDLAVQVPGRALRLRRAEFRELVDRNDLFRRELYNFRKWILNQLAQNVACNTLHNLRSRCCRWLLVAHDSVRCDTFALTHEYLAVMVGVHRPSISEATAQLRDLGFIIGRGGKITIRNRTGLLRQACECYERIHLHRNASLAGAPEYDQRAAERAFL